MKIYLLTLVFLSFLAGALLWLFSSSRYQKHLRYLCSLVLLLCLAAPLKSVFAGDFSAFLPTFEGTAESVSGSYGALLRASGEEALNAELTARVTAGTDLEEGDFSLEAILSLRGEELSLDGVRVYLHSLRAIALREKIRSLLCRDLGERVQLFFVEELP